MALALTVNHIEGLRIRQQIAHKVERDHTASGGAVVGGTEWRFADEVERDTDPRRRDNNGAPLQLPTYTFHIAYGMKNAVIERKGKVENVTFRNAALRNQLRITVQVQEENGKKDKAGKALKEWVKQGTPQYIPANTWTGVNVGDGIRAIVEEMPT